MTNLVIEGDSNYEKNNNFKAINLLAYSTIELFMYYLGSVIIDGNNNFIIYVKKLDNGKKAYENDSYFNVSSYYVNSNVYRTILEMQAQKNYKINEGNIFFLNLIEHTLIEISSISCVEETILLIKEASKKVLESKFELKYKIGKLSKKSNDSQYRANVYRHILPDGENYYVEIVNMESKEIKAYKLNNSPKYVKLEQLISNAFWENHTFHLYNERHHKDIIVLDADNQKIIVSRT